MQFIKTHKNELLKLLLFIITAVGVYIFLNHNMQSQILWPYEKKSRLIIMMFSFVIFEYSTYYVMKKHTQFYTLIYKLVIPVTLAMAFIKLDSHTYKYVPFLLPLIMVLLCHKIMNALLFQSFLLIVYYFNGVFEPDVLILYSFFFVLVFFLAEHSDTTNKFIFSCILSMLSYLIITMTYQYMNFEKIDIFTTLIGLIPLIISIIPLYFRYILIGMNEVYLRNKLNSICDDENELLLSLMSVNENAYFHSLRVADVSIRVAKAVGANYQLVNAGARFHEIGKLKSKNYVAAGIEIMHADKFPREVIKIVKEHNSRTNKPKSLESAIVMLSDSIETTINSIIQTKGPDFNRRKIVENVIDIRFDTGMLDYSIDDIKLYKKLRAAYLAIYS